MQIHYNIQSNTICKHLKFKYIHVPNNRVVSFKLCFQCLQHLTLPEVKEANKPEFTWPSFIWGVLTDKNIKREYGETYIWSFIPCTWRRWWINSFLSRIESTISIDELPQPLFIDQTFEMNDWERLISSQTLPNLKKACNKYLIPKVLCPCGCSEFTFKAGTVSLDLCFQRFLPKVLLKKFVSNKEGLNHIECAQEDFI